MTERDDQLFAAFVGSAEKQSYYGRQLVRFTESGALQYRNSWSWWAFGTGWFFLLYRKLYVEAAVSFVLCVLFVYFGDAWLADNYGEMLTNVGSHAVAPTDFFTAVIVAFALVFLPPIIFAMVSPYLVIRRFFMLQAATANLSPDDQLAVFTQKGGTHRWVIGVFCVLELALFVWITVQTLEQIDQQLDQMRLEQNMGKRTVPPKIY